MQVQKGLMSAAAAGRAGWAGRGLRMFVCCEVSKEWQAEKVYGKGAHWQGKGAPLEFPLVIQAKPGWVQCCILSGAASVRGFRWEWVDGTRVRGRGRAEGSGASQSSS